MHATNTDRRQPHSVTYHAALRWLERVDPREAFPGERVREALERAEPVEREDVVGKTHLDREHDVVLVTGKDGGVKTILREATDD